jgi:putative flippase GtrA
MSETWFFIKRKLKQHNVKVKFLVVGVWNTLFGYFVFFVLDIVFEKNISIKSVAYMSALFLSNIISILNAFIFHKFITFRSQIRGWDVMPEFFRFFLTYIVTFCLSLVLMPFFVEIFKINTKISAALIILLCTVVSYLGHSRFSFKNWRNEDKNQIY